MAQINAEITLVLLKPQVLKRELAGTIISRFEKVGLTIAGMKLEELTEDKAANFYREHEGKPFFQELIATMTSGAIVALALGGEVGTIGKVRKMIGTTDPAKAAPGTIRGDFAYTMIKSDNLVHASDSVASAERELKLFFPELVD